MCPDPILCTDGIQRTLVIQVGFDCLKLSVCGIAGPSVFLKSGRAIHLIEADPGLDSPDMDLVLLCGGSLCEFSSQVLFCHGNLIGWGYGSFFRHNGMPPKQVFIFGCPTYG